MPLPPAELSDPPAREPAPGWLAWPGGGVDGPSLPAPRTACPGATAPRPVRSPAPLQPPRSRAAQSTVSCWSSRGSRRCAGRIRRPGAATPGSWTASTRRRKAPVLETGAVDLEIDGLRPYRQGSPASRIHWPTVARTGEMYERRFVAGADAAPLIVVDASDRGEPEDARPRGAGGGVALRAPRSPGRLRDPARRRGDPHARRPAPADLARRARPSRARRGRRCMPDRPRARRPRGRDLGERRARGPGGPSQHAPRARLLRGDAAARRAAPRSCSRVAGCCGAAREPRRTGRRIVAEGRMTPAGEREAVVVRLVALAALAGFCAFHWANLHRGPPGLARAGRGCDRGRERRRPSPRCAVQPVPAPRGSWPPWRSAQQAWRPGWCAPGWTPACWRPGDWASVADGVGERHGRARRRHLPLRRGRPGGRGSSCSSRFPRCSSSPPGWRSGPAERRAGRLRALALGVLVAAYGIAVVLYAPGLALLHGFVLLALIAAWLWAPRRHRAPCRDRRGGDRDGRGAWPCRSPARRPLRPGLGLPILVLERRASPTSRSTGTTPTSPLDWPREGTALLESQRRAPLLAGGRARALRRVPLGALRGGRTRALELPDKVEGTEIGAHPEWYETDRGHRPRPSQRARGRPGQRPDDRGPHRVDRQRRDGSGRASCPTPARATRSPATRPIRALAQMRGRDGGLPAHARAVHPPRPAHRAPVDQRTVAARGGPRGSDPLRDRAGGGAALEARRSARRAASSARSGYGGVLTALAPADPRRPHRLRRGPSDRAAPPGGTTVHRGARRRASRPLRSFLLETATGYCQQFSGAMALMLRMDGIPARVVSGFSPGARDLDRDGVFTVRDTDAHSWVEVYFTGIGWVPVRPDPVGLARRSLQSALTRRRDPRADIPGGPPGPRARAGRLAGGAGGLTPPAGGGFALGGPPGLPLLAVAAALVGGRRRPAPPARYAALAPRSAQRPRCASWPRPRADARHAAEGGRPCSSSSGSSAAAAGRRRGYAARLRATCYTRDAGDRQPDLRERRAARRELGAARGALRSACGCWPAMPTRRAPARVPADRVTPMATSLDSRRGRRAASSPPTPSASRSGRASPPPSSRRWASATTGRTCGSTARCSWSAPSSSTIPRSTTSRASSARSSGCCATRARTSASSLRTSAASRPLLEEQRPRVMATAAAPPSRRGLVQPLPARRGHVRRAAARGRGPGAAAGGRGLRALPGHRSASLPNTPTPCTSTRSTCSSRATRRRSRSRTRPPTDVDRAIAEHAARLHPGRRDAPDRDRLGAVDAGRAPRRGRPRRLRRALGDVHHGPHAAARERQGHEPQGPVRRRLRGDVRGGHRASCTTGCAATRTSPSCRWRSSTRPTLIAPQPADDHDQRGDVDRHPRPGDRRHDRRAPSSPASAGTRTSSPAPPSSSRTARSCACPRR